MTEIRNNLTPLTQSAVFAGILAAQLSIAAPSEPQMNPPRAIRLAGSLGTFGNVWNESPFNIISEPPLPLISFYAEFVSQQEKLGEEFEEVLFDNLWDIYLR
jgi:hypothetical protein